MVKAIGRDKAQNAVNLSAVIKGIVSRIIEERKKAFLCLRGLYKAPIVISRPVL
jgi:hypothetical protein